MLFYIPEYRPLADIPMIKRRFILAEKIKHRFPSTWRKISMKIKLKGTALEPLKPANIILEGSEDEIHFLNLFKREIDKRKNL